MSADCVQALHPSGLGPHPRVTLASVGGCWGEPGGPAFKAGRGKEAGAGTQDKAWGGHSLRKVGKGTEKPSHLLSTYYIPGAFQMCSDFALTAAL